MPIKARSLTPHTARAWEQVNADFQLVREARDWAAVTDEPMSEREHRVLLNEYERVRAVLYGMLPECEDRE